jgi:hypothetical protein
MRVPTPWRSALAARGSVPPVMRLAVLAHERQHVGGALQSAPDEPLNAHSLRAAR